jgi:hypothetical protein
MPKSKSGIYPFSKIVSNDTEKSEHNQANSHTVVGMI